MSETTAVQDYLKAIYQLGGRSAPVPTSALADALDVRRASVSVMLKRLDELGLVSHVPYKGVRLTRRGTRAALEMVRHHRLLELYLAEVVGMPWDKVHEEADALEHHISEDLESRLAELLGDPTEDPHGHPIPTAKLELTERSYPSLNEARAGARYIVRRVSDRNAALLRHLDGLGIKPGATFEVVDVVAFGGGVRVKTKGAEHVIGKDAADAVLIEASA